MKPKRVTKQFHRQEWIKASWSRPVGGAKFGWFDAVPLNVNRELLDGERRWLLPVRAAEEVSYRPLVDQPALFRTFVDLEPTEDGFRKFADTWGPLWWQTPAGIPQPNGKSYQLVNGVSLFRLRAEHAAMGCVVSVLDALKRPTALRARFEGIAGTTLSNKFIERAVQSRTFSELRNESVGWLQATINTRLNGALPETGDVVLTLLQREETGGLVLQPTTRSLLGILWLQCAKAAEGGQLFKRCHVRSCRNWFLVSPDAGGRRRQAMYCSDRCKVRAFRLKNPTGKREHQRRTRPQRRAQ